MNFPGSFYLKTPKYLKKDSKHLDYGTSGFRDHADSLLHAVYRAGLLAVIRSKAKKGQSIGLMITASHNPECDNGAKLIDPMGDMLEKKWEQYATSIVNADDNKLEKAICELVKEENVDMSIKAKVYLGWDTRPSSKPLSIAASDGVEALQGEVVSVGLTSTPIVHFLVVCSNTQEEYGRASVEGYYSKLASAFTHLHNADGPKKNYVPEIYVDCANGIGSLVLKNMINCLNDLQGLSCKANLKIHVVNDKVFVKDALNAECGADYVKSQQAKPVIRDKNGGVVAFLPNTRYASLDGDADRVLYFYLDEQSLFHLLDGDRIALLIVRYLKELIQKTGVNIQVGLVQTAYANGNSTKYATDFLKIPVACTLTGVKHLHQKAKEFDIGVYFEANGHGTVLFNPKTVENLTRLLVEDSNGLSEDQKKSLRKLLVVRDMINETVGDAIADLLLIETILYDFDWHSKDWINLYEELPSCMLKVIVKDRSVVTISGPEVRCVTPAGLQDRIDSIVSGYPSGRAFVRASGTEDFIRIYAESDTALNAKRLAHDVSLAVHSFAGGIGDPPAFRS